MSYKVTQSKENDPDFGSVPVQPASGAALAGGAVAAGQLEPSEQQQQQQPSLIRRPDSPAERPLAEASAFQPYSASTEQPGRPLKRRAVSDPQQVIASLQLELALLQLLIQ